MTKQEAMQVIKCNYPSSGAFERLCEALDMAIEALEKQIPKKPIIKNNIYTNLKINSCPDCGYTLAARFHKWCPNCGKKIDWSDEE